VCLIRYGIAQEVYRNDIYFLSEKHARNIEEEKAIRVVPPPNAKETHK
jgi:hypothetical protein